MSKIGFDVLAWSAGVSDDLLPVIDKLKEIGCDGWHAIEGFTKNDVGFASSINVWREFAKPRDMAEKGFTFIQEMIQKHAV